MTHINGRRFPGNSGQAVCVRALSVPKDGIEYIEIVCERGGEKKISKHNITSRENISFPARCFLSNLANALCSDYSTSKVKLSDRSPPFNTHHGPPSPHSPASRQEIIHTASHTGVGVLYQPVRSTACLLSPAIEVIHETIILRLIVQENIATPPPPPLTAESYLGKVDTCLTNTLSARSGNGAFVCVFLSHTQHCVRVAKQHVRAI